MDNKLMETIIPLVLSKQIELNSWVRHWQKDAPAIEYLTIVYQGKPIDTVKVVHGFLSAN